MTTVENNKSIWEETKTLIREAVGFIAEEGGPIGGIFWQPCIFGSSEVTSTSRCLKSSRIDKRRYRGSKSRSKQAYGAYLELHVEQGPVLWRKGPSVGIPTAIVGITRYMCTVKGVSNHAGTTPMEERKDAMYDAAVIIHKWLEYMRNQKGVVCNVGYIEVEPGHPLHCSR